VWDGVAYVPHDGLLDRGVQEVISLPNGAICTPDHRFLVDGRWTSAKSICNLGNQEYNSDDPTRDREQVYDIKNCGPRNRFVVRNPHHKEEIIAHNCTQGAARDAFGECILRLEEAGIP